MHNIKEAIYENKSKLEGIGEDYQIQVSTMCGQQPAISFQRQHLVVNLALDFQCLLLLNFSSAK